jgi:glutathione S-transferase
VTRQWARADSRIILQAGDNPAMNAVVHSELPLLYTYRRCPYAMRARLALLVARQPFEAFEIVLRDKPAALLALSPKGTVPVLRLPDGQVLEQSWDIMRWALSADPEGWWSLGQTARNLDLLARNDGPFKQQLDRYKYPERHGLSDPALAREPALQVLLCPLEQILQQSPWLGGERPCATDLALFPFVRQFAAIEPAWWAGQALPALRAWLARWLTSPLFLACMVKLPGQQALRFPLGIGTAPTL